MASNSSLSCWAGDVLPDLGVDDELDALRRHQIDAALHDLLLVELHVGDAIHEQPAERSARSKTVTACPALLSCAAAAKPAGPEPMTATFLPVRVSGGSADDPAFLPTLVDDRAFDVLDRDRRRVDAEHARAFARRGADAAGEFGKVVGLVQPIERLAARGRDRRDRSTRE